MDENKTSIEPIDDFEYIEFEEFVKSTDKSAGNKAAANNAKGKRATNAVFNVLIILLTLVIVFSAWKLVEISMSYIESRREYNDLRQFVTVEEEPENDFVQNPSQGGSKTDASSSKEVPAASSEAEGAKEDPSQDLKEPQEKVFREPTCSISVDFNALWRVSPDIKGWIYLEELDISYPIVQGVDNDQYLYTSVKGTANSGGSIFMDSLNAGDFTDPHTLIYGHNMKDGSMFGKLKKLYDQDRIDNMDTTLCFWIITPSGKYRYDVFAIHTVDAAGDAYTLFAEQSDAVGEYLNKMARHTGVELPQRVYNSKDKVVTLSTCTGNDQLRLIVQGVLKTDTL